MVPVKIVQKIVHDMHFLKTVDEKGSAVLSTRCIPLTCARSCKMDSTLGSWPSAILDGLEAVAPFSLPDEAVPAHTRSTPRARPCQPCLGGTPPVD